MTEPWGSVEQVADHLGVTHDSIYRWIDRKHLPAHRVERLWKFKLFEVVSASWKMTHVPVES